MKAEKHFWVVVFYATLTNASILCGWYGPAAFFALFTIYWIAEKRDSNEVL